MAIFEISVIPVGTKEPGISSFVVEAVKTIKNAGIKFELTPMGTVLEGEIPRIMDIIEKAHEACFKAGAKRVVTSIKIDDRRDKQQSADEKVNVVLGKI